VIDEPNEQADELHDIMLRQDPIHRAIAREHKAIADEHMELIAKKAAMFEQLHDAFIIAMDKFNCSVWDHLIDEAWELRK